MFSFALAIAPRQSEASLRRPGSQHIPNAVKLAQPVDRLTSEKRLNLAIGLPLRNPGELSRLLEQLYDPSSPKYHQYLTTAQFTERFGPTVQDYQALIDFAEAQHFVVTARHSNRMLLSVNASVADIEAAFHTVLRVYPHPTESRNFFAPESEPVLDLQVPVLHISGLNNFQVPRPNMHFQPEGQVSRRFPKVGTGPSGSYWGKDFRKAYAPGVTLDGSGQMVGLFELDGYYPRDVKIYQGQARVPNVPLINVYLDGFDGTPGPDNVEVSLDIELASSMAPGLSAIIVYMADNTGLPDDVLNRMATDNLAKQLSASWSFGIDATTTQIFQQFIAQGQSYFNASGDNGAYSGTPSAPTDNPYITSVGGTTLHTSSTGAWSSESAWGGAVYGTGGGISTDYSLPAWQQGVDMSSNQGSLTKRNMPDVSMIADLVWSVGDNGVSGMVQGTSCSAPLWASFIALVNQQGASVGLPPVGFINPAVYALCQTESYLTNFHDITTGNNTNSSSPSKYFAVKGYDLCTGWGTPIGQNLINTLAPRPNSILITNVGAALVVESCDPANGAIDPGETVTVNFSLQNLGAIPATNIVASLQADEAVLSPSGPQTYGAMTPGGAAVAQAFTFQARGVCGSNIVATLLVAEGTNSLGSVQFSFGLGQPIVIFSENFDGVRAPAIPAGWSVSALNNVSNWTTSTATRDTIPNAAFAIESTNHGIIDLISPPIPISTGAALLSFRHNYNLETYIDDPSKAYDGGVLEIKIGAAAFQDILVAGGNFLSGGYTESIVSEANNDNPLKGRKVWGGLSPGFITTLVTLPTSAAGQTVQLKWRLATDDGNFGGGTGWYVDTVKVQEGFACCSSVADLAVSQTVSSAPALINEPLKYTITVSNAGPQSASGTILTDALPATVTFTDVSSDGVVTNGTITWFLGSLTNSAVTNVWFTAIPVSNAPLTNVIAAGSTAIDPSDTNNQSLLITEVATNGAPPSISLSPVDLVVVQGSNAVFQVAASGVPNPAYAWIFNEATVLPVNNNTLVLTNVQAEFAGRYIAVVTNSLGSATSSVARLTVLVSPTLLLSSVAYTPTNFSVSLSSLQGLAYGLEYKDSLNDTNWIPLLPTVLGNGGVISVLDTNPPTAFSRFYRVNCFPAP